MKVAIVHDDLMQWGGAERVLLGICEVFPDAPIYTSVFDEKNSTLQKNFQGKKIITSFMQNIPGFRNMYKLILPLYPISFEQFDFSQYDLVISQTTRFAKSIITKPQTLHICYCHTPPRFLWNFSMERGPKFLNKYFDFLRRFDLVSAKRVDKFLAGSENAKSRIKEIYDVSCEVLYPFVDTEKFKIDESFDGGYFLILTRLNKYKKVNIAVEAFNKNGLRLKIVGVGSELADLKKQAKPNIEFLGRVDEEILVNLILGAQALIICAEEDFGLTSLEAQSCGKAVIAFGVGGARETIVENLTGVFFNEQTAQSLEEAIKKFQGMKFDPKLCRQMAEKFSKDKFKERLNRCFTR